MKKFIMKLRRVGTHSYAITLPKELIKSWRWKERQKLELVVKGRKKEIVVKDWKK